jgi:anti-sigma factor RsiW
MKLHNPELVSALLDGELKGLRGWLVKRHVSRCALCAGEYRRGHHLRAMLAANPATPAMSDSPDFFWSKVSREIHAREGQTTEVPMPTLSLSDWLGQHQFALASVVGALVVVVGLMIALRSAHAPSPTPMVAIIEAPVATVEHASTFIPDTVATSFDAKDAEPAVIWVSGLPWAQDMTEMKTQFAQLDL